MQCAKVACGEILKTQFYTLFYIYHVPFGFHPMLVCYRNLGLCVLQRGLSTIAIKDRVRERGAMFFPRPACYFSGLVVAIYTLKTLFSALGVPG